MAVKLLAELTPAKINLFLRVVGRRPDGYHELDSIFVPVSLYDSVRLEVRPADAASISMRSEVPDRAADVPNDDRNLAWRAAAAFMAEFAITAEVRIELRKRIPVGAGLGGGSSDAGAVLRMMAELNRINQPARLARLAAGIGADVPFFLAARAARVGGIGEKIVALKLMSKLNFVIAVPAGALSTAEIFRELRREDWSGPAGDPEVSAITEGRIEPAMLVNDLEKAAIRRCPEIAQLKAILNDLGASAAAMTGSGSAVFGLFAGAEAAAKAAEEGARRAPASRFIPAASLK